MAYEFKLPDLGEGLTEGEIGRWLVEVGQEIAEDDPLVEIATDKTTVEIPSPAAGVVAADPRAGGRRRSRRDGDRRDRRRRRRASRGRAGADGVGTAEAGRRPHGEASVRATPLVRRLAQELGVDLATIAGSGPQGRITEADVRGTGGPAPVPTRREARADPRHQAADVRAPHARARDPRRSRGSRRPTSATST